MMMVIAHFVSILLGFVLPEQILRWHQVSGGAAGGGCGELSNMDLEAQQQGTGTAISGLSSDLLGSPTSSRTTHSQEARLYKIQPKCVQSEAPTSNPTPTLWLPPSTLQPPLDSPTPSSRAVQERGSGA